MSVLPYLGSIQCLSPSADNLASSPLVCSLPPQILLKTDKPCLVRMLAHTLPSTLRALSSVLILSTTSGAFQVSPSSPCSPQCTIDGAVNTDTSEVVCSDADFSTTSTGLKFKNCIDCLQSSRYFSGDDSDVAWFLYNLRFAADVCLFQYPGANLKNETSACNVDYVCKPLQSALATDKLDTAGGNEFGYCTADNSAFRGQSRTTCIGCLQASPSNKYLSNFLIALEAGCEQQRVLGKTLGLSGSLFSQVAVNITGVEAASNATGTDQNDSPTHLSVGAIVGISVGSAAVFLGGGLLFLLYYCRQRRYNKEDRARRASYTSYLGHPTYPLYPGENTEIALEGPSYTLDYKSPTQDTDGGDGDSEVSYNKASDVHQRQPTAHSRQLSREELQKSPSAMPTHPAYIPRAIIRRNSPATTTPSQFSSTQHSKNPSFDSQAPIALSAPPPARRPSRTHVTDSASMQTSSHSASESTGSTTSLSQRRDRQKPVALTINPSLETDIHHTAVRQLEQHGIYAADQQPQHIPQQQHHPSPDHQPLASFTAGPGPAKTTRARASSTSSTKSSPANPTLIQPVPLHASRSRGRPQLAPLAPSGPANGTTATTTTHRTRQQQQQKTPPFQQKTPPFQQQQSSHSGKPLPGLEDIEISGPLAFPDDRRRTFRDWSVPDAGVVGGAGAGAGAVGHGTVGPGAARFAGNAAVAGGAGRGAVEQAFIRKGWVDEVPLVGAEEELW